MCANVVQLLVHDFVKGLLVHTRSGWSDEANRLRSLLKKWGSDMRCRSRPSGKMRSCLWTGPSPGWTALATGCTKQFNPRVRPDFLERFARAQAFEEELTGEKITQAYFLELLLSIYARAQGGELGPLGLSEPAFANEKALRREGLGAGARMSKKP